MQDIFDIQGLLFKSRINLKPTSKTPVLDLSCAALSSVERQQPVLLNWGKFQFLPAIVMFFLANFLQSVQFVDRICKDCKGLDGPVTNFRLNSCAIYSGS